MILCLLALGALADQYHFKNILIGDRAVGLGGAYTAISDDPSGMYYNPAGMAFAMENYMSGSANAYATSTSRYKNIIPGQDYLITSSQLTPSFFAFSQSFGKTKVAFGIAVPNADLNDQNDTITNISPTTNKPNNLKRRLFEQDITYTFATGIAREVAESLSFGISFLGSLRIHKRIDNQFVFYNPIPTGVYYYNITYLDQEAFSLAPKIGIQYMPIPKLSLGLTLSKNINISSSGKQQTYNKTTAANGYPKIPTGEASQDMTIISTNNVFANAPAPLTISGGAAYFVTKRFLVTCDADAYFADPTFLDYQMLTVLNVVAGIEYFLTDLIPLRLGIFTNNANTPRLVQGRTNQTTHVDLLGLTAALAFVQSGSSFSLAVTSTTGSGGAQIIGNNTTIQILQQSSLNVYLSGSYQL